jgi:hypothetical protein
LTHEQPDEQADRPMKSQSEPLIPNPTVVTQLTPEGAVLVEMNSGDCYELNRTGAEIWSRINDGEPLPAIVASVAKRHAVPESTVDADARTLLAELVRRGLVTTAQK